MALNIVERDIRAAVDRYSDTELRKKMGQTYLHDIRISSENASVAFQQGVVNVMEGMKFTQEEMNQINQSYNSTSNWKNIVITYVWYNSLTINCARRYIVPEKFQTTIFPCK